MPDMGGLSMGMLKELVEQRRTELSRQAGVGARDRRGRGGRSRPIVARRTGRLLVAAGIRLAGPDALRGVKALSA